MKLKYGIVINQVGLVNTVQEIRPWYPGPWYIQPHFGQDVLIGRITRTLLTALMYYWVSLDMPTY